MFYNAFGHFYIIYNNSLYKGRKDTSGNSEAGYAVELTLVRDLSKGSNAQQVVISKSFTVLLDKDGLCYAIGLNKFGELGVGDEHNRTELTRMIGLPEGVTARQVKCGNDYTMIVGSDGWLYASGVPHFLEINVKANSYELTRKVHLSAFKGMHEVAQVAFGRSHMVVLYKDGSCYALGDNTDGQLGTGNNENKCQLTPMMMENFPQNATVVQVMCVECHTVVLLSNGFCYATGNNEYGQLAVGDKNNRNKLTRMIGLEQGVTVRQLSLGTLHTVVLCNDNFCYTAGGHFNQKLGTGDEHDRTKLTRMIGLPERVNVRQVECGNDYTMVLTADNLCYSTDIIKRLTAFSSSSTPNGLNLMEGLPSGVTVKSIACGENAIVLGSDGYLYVAFEASLIVPSRNNQRDKILIRMNFPRGTAFRTKPAMREEIETYNWLPISEEQTVNIDHFIIYFSKYFLKNNVSKLICALAFEDFRRHIYDMVFTEKKIIFTLFLYELRQTNRYQEIVTFLERKNIDITLLGLGGASPIQFKSTLEKEYDTEAYRVEIICPEYFGDRCKNEASLYLSN